MISTNTSSVKSSKTPQKNSVNKFNSKYQLNVQGDEGQIKIADTKSISIRERKNSHSQSYDINKYGYDVNKKIHVSESNSKCPTHLLTLLPS